MSKFSRRRARLSAGPPRARRRGPPPPSAAPFDRALCQSAKVSRQAGSWRQRSSLQCSRGRDAVKILEADHWALVDCSSMFTDHMRPVRPQFLALTRLAVYTVARRREDCKVTIVCFIKPGEPDELIRAQTLWGNDQYVPSLLRSAVLIKGG